MTAESLGIVLQAFQVEEQHLIEHKTVLPAQCNHLTALHTLRLDCFSEMKCFPLQVLFQPTNQRLLVPAWALAGLTDLSTLKGQKMFVSGLKGCIIWTRLGQSRWLTARGVTVNVPAHLQHSKGLSSTACRSCS